MKATIYLSPKLAKLFKDSNIEEKESMADEEILLVNTESVVDAFLEDKSQISSERACVKMRADGDKLRIFFRGISKTDLDKAKKDVETSEQ